MLLSLRGGVFLASGINHLDGRIVRHDEVKTVGSDAVVGTSTQGVRLRTVFAYVGLDACFVGSRHVHVVVSSVQNEFRLAGLRGPGLGPGAVACGEGASGHVDRNVALCPFPADGAASVGTAIPEGEFAIAVVDLVAGVALLIHIVSLDIIAQVAALGKLPESRVAFRNLVLVDHDGIRFPTSRSQHLDGSGKHHVGTSFLVDDGVALRVVTRAAPEVGVGVGRLARCQRNVRFRTVVADVQTARADAHGEPVHNGFVFNVERFVNDFALVAVGHVAQGVDVREGVFKSQRRAAPFVPRAVGVLDERAVLCAVGTLGHENFAVFNFRDGSHLEAAVNRVIFLHQSGIVVDAFVAALPNEVIASGHIFESEDVVALLDGHKLGAVAVALGGQGVGNANSQRFVVGIKRIASAVFLSVGDGVGTAVHDFCRSLLSRSLHHFDGCGLFLDVDVRHVREAPLAASISAVLCVGVAAIPVVNGIALLRRGVQLTSAAAADDVEFECVGIFHLPSGLGRRCHQFDLLVIGSGRVQISVCTDVLDVESAVRALLKSPAIRRIARV